MAEPERLFEDNISWAVNLAKKYSCQKNTRHLKDDIYSEARIGLWRACMRFDASQNLAFSTIAYLLIRGAILDFLRKEKIHVRLSRNEKPVQFISLGLGTTDGRGSGHPRELHRQIGAALTDNRSEMDISSIHADTYLDWTEGRGELTEIQSITLRKYYREGKSLREIADESTRPYRRTAAAFRSGVEILRQVAS